MDLGPHALFIWLSYAAVTAVIGALIGWLTFDGKRQARALSDLESRGVKRRSSAPGSDA
ncbi:MAG: heme exporter protein CcmD [Hyphomicrobium sp.]